MSVQSDNGDLKRVIVAILIFAGVILGAVVYFGSGADEADRPDAVDAATTDTLRTETEIRLEGS